MTTSPSDRPRSRIAAIVTVLLLVLAAAMPQATIAARLVPPSPVAAGTGAPPGDPAATCAALVKHDFSTLKDAPSLIVSATAMPAGDLPAHCLVEGRIAPTIGFRLWLPLGTWNGRYAQSGCGGRCGHIIDEECQVLVARGYACLAADMGHTGTMYDELWAIDNVPGEIDYGFRSTHVAALAGKAVASFFYGRRPTRAYFLGASQGGRQGLVEAQDFPNDFDGIVAGEPRMASPSNTPAQHASIAAAKLLSSGPGGSALVSPAQLRAVNAYVVAKCDMDDNLKDGIISDPRRCRFDPVELACKDDAVAARQAAGDTCLTASQVAVMRTVYRGTVDDAGRMVSPGPLPGSELHWIGAYVAADGGPGRWAPRYARGMDEDPYANIFVNSANPDLRAFKARGGKLILYMGWADETNVPGPTVDYYETTERTMGGRAATQAFFRLFMVPGEGHIPIGTGAETVDYLSYLEAWVERGQSPDVLLGAKLKTHVRFAGPLSFASELGADNVAFTRPIYPYPVQARYRGRGDPDDAASFEPKMPANP